MQVCIEVPEDVSQSLRERWSDIPKRALEALAIEGYRSGALSESQVRRMLGLETRIEVHEFLKREGVFLDYTPSDLQEDLETHRRLGVIPPR